MLPVCVKLLLSSRRIIESYTCSIHSLKFLNTPLWFLLRGTPDPTPPAKKDRLEAVIDVTTPVETFQIVLHVYKEGDVLAM